MAAPRPAPIGLRPGFVPAGRGMAVCHGCGVIAPTKRGTCVLCEKTIGTSIEAVPPRADRCVWAYVRTEMKCRQCGQKAPIDEEILVTPQPVEPSATPLVSLAPGQTPPPTPAPTPRPPREPVDVDLLDDPEAAFIHQQDKDWCAVAGTQMVLAMHGGPHSAYGTDFSFYFQWMAANGLAVLYTNPRGSTEYGEKFLWGTWGGWGGVDYQDVMAGVDYAVAHYAIDPKRLGDRGEPRSRSGGVRGTAAIRPESSGGGQEDGWRD